MSRAGSLLFLTMADLTLVQRFGDDVAFDPATKKLTIDLNNLSQILIDGIDYGLNSSAMTDANKDEYSARIFWALMQKHRASQPATNNDETVGVYVTNEGRRNAIRNQVPQHGFRLVATAYANDTVGIDLDPDNIG